MINLITSLFQNLPFLNWIEAHTSSMTTSTRSVPWEHTALYKLSVLSECCRWLCVCVCVRVPALRWSTVWRPAAAELHLLWVSKTRPVICPRVCAAHTWCSLDFSPLSRVPCGPHAGPSEAEGVDQTRLLPAQSDLSVLQEHDSNQRQKPGLRGAARLPEGGEMTFK